ncbi:MAG: alpha/beta hydrolase [Solirubrobacteraceae bacterium]
MTRAAAIEPTEAHLQIGQSSLRYLTWGDPALPPVVLLHGRTAIVETWTEVAQALAERYYVLALEQRGHGRSSWSPTRSYNLEDFLGDLEEFADRVVGRPFILVGHSMGACTALVYTARHPQSVRALVLEDGGPPGATVLEAVRKAKADVPLRFPSWAAARAQVENRNAWLGAAALERELRASLREDPAGGVSWRSDIDGLLADSHTDRDETFLVGQWEAARQLRTPTLFLWASAPALMDAEVAERFERSSACIRRVTIDCGHSIHEERQDRFLAEIEPFLASAP